MAAEHSSERDLLRAAMASTPECLHPEKLERCLDAIPPEFAAHLDGCSCCQAELELLRSFHRAPNERELEAVYAITERLRLPVPAQTAAPDAWWKGLLRGGWLSPAAVAMAGVLIVVAIGIQWRHDAIPQLRGPAPAEQDVLRSTTVTVTAPVGDLRQAPDRIVWQPVAGGARYQVRVLEVDRTELWEAFTNETQSVIPAGVKAKILPAKTLLLEITAFDSAGRKLAESGSMRFRLLQKIYAH